MAKIYTTRGQFLIFGLFVGCIVGAYALLRRTKHLNDTREPQQRVVDDQSPQDTTTAATEMKVLSSTQERTTYPSRRSTILQRARSIYQTIAVLSLNTLIFSLIALWVIDWFLPEPPRVDPQRAADAPLAEGLVPRYYSGGINPNAFRYSPIEVIYQMGLEFDVYASLGHWQVNPWTGLTLRPFRGRYLNIDNNGYRITPPPDPAFAALPPLTIWAFGGSTVFGQSLPDNSTLPAALQRTLQPFYPDRHVIVKNFGIPWYFSSQELALFTQHLRLESAPPDIALFLDGLNEIYALTRYNNQTPLIRQLAGAWEAEIARITNPFAEPWLSFNPSFPPSRLAQQLGIGAPVETGDINKQYAYADGLSLRFDDDPIVFAAEQYTRNQRMGLALAAEFGVSAYYVWQPLRFWRDDPIYLSLGAAIAQRVEPAHFFDLQAVFDPISPDVPLLADPTHYSDYAVQLLAEAITSLIVERELENS